MTHPTPIDTRKHILRVSDHLEHFNFGGFGDFRPPPLPTPSTPSDSRKHMFYVFHTIWNISIFGGSVIPDTPSLFRHPPTHIDTFSTRFSSFGTFLFWGFGYPRHPPFLFRHPPTHENTFSTRFSPFGTFLFWGVRLPPTPPLPLPTPSDSRKHIFYAFHTIWNISIFGGSVTSDPPPLPPPTPLTPSDKRKQIFNVFHTIWNIFILRVL